MKSEALRGKESLAGRPPLRTQPYYHWYNIPVSSVPGHPDNALSYIKTIARPEDYVLLKIDIDHNPTETGIIKQLLASDELLGLVDELYFEHHVNVGPMHYHWNTENDKQRLADTYRLFSAFRQKGILAHPWI